VQLLHQETGFPVQKLHLQGPTVFEHNTIHILRHLRP
jgi:hypothetical protein